MQCKYSRPELQALLEKVFPSDACKRLDRDRDDVVDPQLHWARRMKAFSHVVVYAGSVPKYYFNAALEGGPGACRRRMARQLAHHRSCWFCAVATWNVEPLVPARSPARGSICAFLVIIVALRFLVSAMLREGGGGS